MWDRLMEVHADDFAELRKVLSSMCGDPQTGRGPGISKKKDDYWTPLRDALTLATVDRRKEL
jgi:hypothetical protein